MSHLFNGGAMEHVMPGDIPSDAPEGHDIIVIGASAGGVEALQKLVRDLPSDLPAALFVVMHVSPEGPGLLPSILAGAGQLPASHPKDRDVIKIGNIYVAPPNYHIMLDKGIIRVARGPKENRHRPAIDPLFRSAARVYGPRVVGVILTGMLDDGTAGLLAVKQHGGIAVVQDPIDALYPSMPMSALRRVSDADYTVPLSKMGSLLARLAREQPEAPLSSSVPEQKGDNGVSERIEIEDEFALSDNLPVDTIEKIGTPSTIACPECHGTLWEVSDNGLLRFRCRVGHAYTAQTLLSEHAESLESALWIALRTLEESASLNRRLSERAQRDNQLLSASRFMENALQTEQHIEIIKAVLLTNKALGEQAEA